MKAQLASSWTLIFLKITDVNLTGPQEDNKRKLIENLFTSYTIVVVCLKEQEPTKNQVMEAEVNI